jgi:SAM-dependent methyltransferase
VEKPKATIASAAGVSAVDSCWVCFSPQSGIWKQRGIGRPLEPADFAITDHRYGTTLSLRKCQRCGFVFAAKEEVGELLALYERLHDPGYEETQDTRSLQMKAILQLVHETQPRARTLLDIGAGAGLLVALAKEAGYEAVGIEPSRSLVAAASRLNGVDLVQGTFPNAELEGRVFDVILLVDVIEHLSDPIGLLRHCRLQLAPGGLVIIVTPDIGSFAARLLGRRWWHFRLAHVGYFTRETLGTAARTAGLRPLLWKRAKWYFRTGYLADRVAEYLPVSWLNRIIRRRANVLMNIVVPVNLRDSWVCVLARLEESMPSSSGVDLPLKPQPRAPGG